MKVTGTPVKNWWNFGSCNRLGPISSVWSSHVLIRWEHAYRRFPWCVWNNLVTRYDSFHWKCHPVWIIQILKLKFLGVNLHHINMPIWICIATSRKIQVSRWGRFWVCINFSWNCHPPDPRVIYVHPLVNRSQQNILRITPRKYLKPCPEDFILQDLILRTRVCGTGFVS